MYVHGFEARAVESRGHFDLSIHALLAQDGHARPCAATDEGRGQVLIRIEAQPQRNTRVVLVAAGLMLLAGASRIVTQALHGKGGLGPDPTQIRARVFKQELIATTKDDARTSSRAPDAVDVPGRTSEGCAHRGHVRLAHLNHGTQFLREEQGRACAGLSR